MGKAAFWMLFVAVLVGAMMPDGHHRHLSGADHPTRITTASEPRKDTELLRSSSGHFYTYAKVNGEVMKFLVDTGADFVALTTEDAERLGIDTNPATFTVIAEGASGPVRGRMVNIDSIEIDGKLVNDVQGAVLEGSNLSLLGQSYLSRMGRVEMSGDYMVLR